MKRHFNLLIQQILVRVITLCYVLDKRFIADDEDWQQTYTCRKFYPFRETGENVNLLDIAHALANLCRFNGHTKFFYSVGQHSVLVADLVYDWTNNKKLALAALLHDASEAYFADLPSPVKRRLIFNFYRQAEDRLQSVIYQKFGVRELITPDHKKIIKKADLRVLEIESHSLMTPTHPDWKVPFTEDTLPIVWTHQEAKANFIQRYKFYGGNIADF